jgi:hypothetical protein
MGERRTLRTRSEARAAVATALVAVLVLLVAAAMTGCGAADSDPVQETAPAKATSSPPAVLPASPSPRATVAASPEPFASPAATPEAAASPEPTLERPTKKDPLRIYFGGDSLSGMPAVMLAQLTAKNRLAKVRADYVESSRLTYGEPVDWPSRVREKMSAGHYDVGIFMIGANDSGMPMIADGDSVMYPKRKWLDEYKRRAKKIAALMLRGGADRVYWVGMPIMPRSSDSRKMRDLNAIFEEVAASSPEVVYVDSYDLLSTRSGDFKASVRSGDGVHYTNEGAMVVARAVWRAIKADWGGR